MNKIDRWAAIEPPSLNSGKVQAWAESGGRIIVSVDTFRVSLTQEDFRALIRWGQDLLRETG